MFFPSFRHSTWTCLLAVLLLVTAKITHVPGLYLYWPTAAIILTMIIFLGLFILVSSFTPMLIRTRKAVRLLKKEQNKRKKSICAHLSIWCDMFNIWIRTSSQSAIFHVARRHSWAFVRRHQYISHSVTCYSWNILFLFTN